jgi:hypothetical protein
MDGGCSTNGRNKKKVYTIFIGKPEGISIC